METCAPYIPPVLAPRVGALVTVGASPAVFPNNTWLAFVWGTELFDSDGFYTAGSNHLTIPAGEGGLYAATAVLHWVPGGVANSSHETELNMGGVPLISPGEYTFTSGYQNASATLPLASGQQVYWAARHGTGVDRQIDYALLGLFKIGQ